MLASSNNFCCEPTRNCFVFLFTLTSLRDYLLDITNTKYQENISYALFFIGPWYNEVDSFPNLQNHLYNDICLNLEIPNNLIWYTTINFKKIQYRFWSMNSYNYFMTHSKKCKNWQTQEQLKVLTLMQFIYTMCSKIMKQNSCFLIEIKKKSLK